MKRKIHPLVIMILLFAFVAQMKVFATKHVINVQNFSFSPASITDVQLGDTIRWVWVSGSHTTTSTTIPAAATAWNSPISSTNTSFEYKVVVPGTFNYKCIPHSAMGMVGSFTAVEAPSLSVAPSNQNVTAASGNTEFSVTSNSSWTAGSNSAWCSVTLSGSGNGILTATFSENSSVNPRTASISVVVTGLPAQIVTVTQEGAARTLSVTPPSQNVQSIAGSTTFSVTSNSTWTAQSDADWCSVTPSGDGDGTILATYSENPGNTVRTATLSILVSGLPAQMVTVIQDLSSVSVKEQSSASFRLFPNPSKGLAEIELRGIRTENARVSVMALSGKVVLEKSYSASVPLVLDASSLPKGIYIVKLITMDSQYIQRLVLID